MKSKPQLFAPSENTEVVNLFKYFEILKKPVIILLVFSFLLSSFVPVYAIDKTTEEASSTTTDTSINKTTDSVTPEQVQEVQKVEQTTEVGKNNQESLETENIPQTSSLMSSTDPDPIIQKPTLNSSLPKADEVSGALVTEYPISVPPGRNGFQPDLKLQYNSQNSSQIDSEFGSGWSLNIPYIERMNKNGVEKFYATSTPYFSSSLSGELVTSTTATSTYLSKVDNGEFLNYTYSNDLWTVKDKKGYQYFFGNSNLYNSTTTASGTPELYNTSLYNDGNILSYYRLEGNSSDSKNTYNATGTSVSYDNAYGKFNQGASFNGSSSKLDMGSVLSSGTNFWMHGWFKTTSVPNQNENTALFGTNSWSGDGQINANLRGTAGNHFKLQFSIYDVSAGAPWSVDSTETNLSANIWYMWDFVYDYTNKAWKIYINGSLDATVTHGSAVTLNSPKTLIANNGAQNNFWAGYLDDLAIFNRTPTTSEVSNLYNGTLTSTSTQTITAKLDDLFNTAHTNKWYLDHILDPNGNQITYEYYKSGNQIYPSIISYAGNTTSTPLFTVDFTRENRTDNSTSTKAGFLVATNERIKNININKNGSLVKQYALTYSTGTNGARSLLTSVAENGLDENNSTTTLPAINFTYQPLDGGWQSTTSTMPTALKYAYLADVNVDGYADIMNSFTDSTTTTQVTYLNNTQGGWATSTPYSPPTIFFGPGTYCDVVLCDKGVRLLDVNGDGLVDILSNNSNAYINTGSGWTASSTWISPLAFVNVNQNYGNSQYAEVGDLNGDGFPDIFQIWHDTLSEYHDAYLNNGNGWTYTANFSVPVGIDKQNGRNNIDLNGDGLTDFIQSFDTVTNNDDYNFAIINNSTSTWTSYAPYKAPLYFVVDTTDKGVRFIDMNGDGLQDLNQNIDSTVDVKSSYFNTGTGWGSSNVGWASPLPFASELISGDTGTRIADINGDGMQDVVQANEVSGSIVSLVYYLNQKRTDVLNKITYPEGGSTSIAYKPAGKYVDGSNNLLNPDIRNNVDTVYQIVTHDGISTSTTDTYTYKGGKNYYNGALDKKFAGFNEIDKTDSTGNVVKTFYHQADTSASTTGEYLDNYFKIGKPYRIEQYDNAGNLFKKIINKWESSTTTASSTSAFVKLSQKVEFDYEGDSSHKDKAESYTYSTKGDLTQKIEWGEVSGSNDGSFSDTGGDKFTTSYTYATSSTSTVVSSLSSESTTDQSSNKVKETRYYYDTLGLGLVNKGNLTKKEDWKVGSTYVNSQKTYNGYGLVTTDTDPRGKVTTYSYDTNNLYPSTVTNPVGLVNTFVYDYSSGKVATTTDPNGNNFLNVYDGLDRLILQKQPDPSATSTLFSSVTYTYTDIVNSTAIKKSVYLDASTTVDSYTYLDGLRRKKQERTGAEGTNYSVKDYVYNSLGQLQKETLPYFSSGYATTTATSTAGLFINYLYEALGRVATTSNAIGTTTNTYLDWRVTTTDMNGKVKDLYSDAYGNLIQVDEHNSSATYSTTYTYDYNKSLTNITDSAGSVRNFTYDGLGRRLTAQDLHASGDGTYGAYTYTYDDSGNITQKVDPKSQTVNYTYDDINRPLTEDYTGTGGTEVAYTYDTCTQGNGKLCTASSTALTISNVYNALGQLTQETKVISGNSFTTSYTYDRQGNQLIITNQDSSQVKYIYNSAGLIEQLQRKESTDGSYIDVVTDFNYSPLGQITEINYDNGAITTNTYDPIKLYRLVKKLTTLPVDSESMMRSSEGEQMYYYTPSEDFTTTTIETYSTSTPESTASTTPTSTPSFISSSTPETATTTNSTETPVSLNNNTKSFFAKLFNAVAVGFKKTVNFFAWIFSPFSAFASSSEIYDTSLYTDSNIKAYYRMEGDSNDSKGSYNGTDTAMSYNSSYGFFNQGSALNGSNSKVDTGNPLGTGTNFTVHGWFNVQNVPSLNTQVALWGNNAWSGSGQIIGDIKGTGSSHYQLDYFDVYGVSPDGLNSSTTTLSGNTWYMFDFVYDYTNKYLRLYINGVQDSYSALSVAPALANTKFLLGTNGAQNNYVSAYMDDVTIFNRVLTPTEIADLYSGALTPAKRTIQNINYTYDSNGNITQLTESASTTLERTLTYTYDDLNRLTNASTTRATSTPYTYSYTYDRVGNMLTRVENGTTTTYTYATSTSAYLNPHAVATTTAGSSLAYTYDNNGNLLTVRQGTTTPTSTYTWDYNNRLTQAVTTTGGNATSTFAYDPSGQRVKMTVATGTSVTTYYPTKEYNITGTVPTKHIFLPDGTMIATIVGTGTSTTVSYIHIDHLGGTNVVTSDAGAVSELVDAYPYGTLRINEQNGSSEQRKGISGHEYDSASSLTYMNSRYFNAVNTRFISQDPMFWETPEEYIRDPQQWNSYSYARNNPIVNTDPTGENAAAGTMVLGGGGAIVAGGGAIVGTYVLGGAVIVVAGTAGAYYGINAVLYNPDYIGNQSTPSSLLAPPVSTSEYKPSGDFSPKTKEQIDKENETRNDGKQKCDNCGKEVKQPEKPGKGKTPSPDEKNYDHKTPKKQGGDNSPDNGSIKCRDCNLRKGPLNEDQFRTSPNNPLNKYLNPFSSWP